MMHGLEGFLIYRDFFDYLFLTVLFIKLQNMYVTVLYSYKNYCRIVRFSDVNAMMHGLEGLSLSLIMHNNFLITYLLLLFT